MLTDAAEVGAASSRAVVGNLHAWGRARGTQSGRDPRLEYLGDLHLLQQLLCSCLLCSHAILSSKRLKG